MAEERWRKFRSFSHNSRICHTDGRTFCSCLIPPCIVCNAVRTVLQLKQRIYTVFQKSDAKIQTTITTAHLIRINYPLSSFNYRLSGTNVANFNKIHLMVSEQQHFKQVAQLSQRDRAAEWVSYRQRWKSGTGRQYLWTL